jgi:N-acetylmuramoyl-L-alanine amidase
VLLDLSQTASQTASDELGSQLIAQLSKVTNLHHKTVQRAGFMVLKSPDIPSVLVELGFISNPSQEKKLSDPKHQQVLARALLSGVKAYAGKYHAPLKQVDDWTLAHK